MVFAEYNADILPEITLSGHHNYTVQIINPDRVSDDFIFYFLLDGEIFVNEDGIDYHLQKGDCFLFEPGLHHFGTQKSTYDLFFIHFKHPKIRISELSPEEWNDMFRERTRKAIVSVADSVTSDTILIPKYIRLKTNKDINKIADILTSVVTNGDMHKDGSKVISSCEMDRMFIELYRICCEPQVSLLAHRATVHTIINYLNENYQRHLRSDIIESELLYNYDYLNRLLSREAGITIFRALEAIRIENAKKLIIGGTMSFTQIAERVGFEDESYFSKVFKKSEGMSPSKYRSEKNKA